MLTLINPDGTVTDHSPITLDEMRRLYSDVVEARTYDHKCMALQQQGRLATYAPFEGQEAAQIGAAAALRSDDWVAATYRDAALMWRAGYRGVSSSPGGPGTSGARGQPPEGVNVHCAIHHRRRAHDPRRGTRSGQRC